MPADEGLSDEEIERLSSRSVELGTLLATYVGGLPPEEHYQALLIITAFGAHMVRRYHGVDAARDLLDNLRDEFAVNTTPHRPKAHNVN